VIIAGYTLLIALLGRWELWLPVRIAIFMCRVAAWGDPRYVTRLTEDYVDRLLALKRTGEALDVVSARLTHDPSFRPKSAAATLQIARIAAAGGGTPRVARTLLADFPARFAGDPCVAAAAALARHLGS
jgi:hypothetical protein